MVAKKRLIGKDIPYIYSSPFIKSFQNLVDFNEIKSPKRHFVTLVATQRRVGKSEFAKELLVYNHLKETQTNQYIPLLKVQQPPCFFNAFFAVLTFKLINISNTSLLLMERERQKSKTNGSFS